MPSKDDRTEAIKCYWWPLNGACRTRRASSPSSMPMVTAPGRPSPVAEHDIRPGDDHDRGNRDALAHGMIEVHGTRTAAVARENARAAALAGQAMQAKSWIRMLGIIQRRQAGQVSPLPTSCDPSAGGTAKQ